jgi:hypothetical protein
MTVQIIENWSEIQGIVRSCHPSEDVAGFEALELEVEQVRPVDGFANLLEHTVGTTLVVLMPDELIRSLQLCPGDRMTCWVRRANLDRAFVHREHVSVRHLH